MPGRARRHENRRHRRGNRRTVVRKGFQRPGRAARARHRARYARAVRAGARRVLPPEQGEGAARGPSTGEVLGTRMQVDRKSTRLNSSHVEISYAVFCLKKKKRAKEY